jgi:hypothetical protein
MNEQDMEFITNLGNILSFVDLQKIYETWEHDGSIIQKGSLLQLGYVSLISHPAIFLTKDDACKELKAANVCHDLWLKYDKDGINEKINGDNEKLSTATKILVLPPHMYLAAKIDRFYLLHYLLIGMFRDKSDHELSECEGDLFAKAWLSLLEKGYKGEMTEKEFNADIEHRLRSREIILKLKLSDNIKIEMDFESLKPKWEKYVKSDNSGSGCMITLLIAIGTLSSMVACLGLVFDIF